MAVAYTIDIETLALPDFRERVGAQLERALRLGNMRLEQQQRYLEDIAAEEERCYQLGSLSAISGRVLCIAVHVGPVAGAEIDPRVTTGNDSDRVSNGSDSDRVSADSDRVRTGSDSDRVSVDSDPVGTGSYSDRVSADSAPVSTGSDSDRVNTVTTQGVREYIFGIDAAGNEESESDSLKAFLNLLKTYNPDTDEIVGHNILSFDLPFVFQRCLVNDICVRAYLDADVCTRNVFDTMHRWWLGSRRNVSLDDLAWALGIASSKTPEVEGSKVFDLYQAGRLAEIREYNLNDVRVTRKVYERLIACFGR
ncbi:MAG TPA: ribonuclease H-like domain-containing protein [Pyrinomonadaceae bacterium]|nr:ribonuclease H-like domain-containing protein [Pyrinomonadaceae bacterium]